MKENAVNETKAEKPLGIMPRWRHVELRLEEIAATKIRYEGAGKEIPEEWKQEERELLEAPTLRRRASWFPALALTAVGLAVGWAILLASVWNDRESIAEMQGRIEAQEVKHRSAVQSLDQGFRQCVVELDGVRNRRGAELGSWRTRLDRCEVDYGATLMELGDALDALSASRWVIDDGSYLLGRCRQDRKAAQCALGGGVDCDPVAVQLDGVVPGEEERQ